MRIAKILLLLPLFVLLDPHRASAQGCVGLMTSAYSSYDAYSTDGTYVYSSATVDGYANIHTSEYCSIPYGTTHHGEVSVQLGSTVKGSTGPLVCPSCYISVSASVQVPADDGIVYLADSYETIICSDIGTIYGSGGSQNVTNVPLYSATCGVVGGSMVLGCGWGGPGTCCNPTIKASTYYATAGHSCTADNCVTWTTGNTTYTDCCCSSAVVNSDCTEILSGKVCETSSIP